jgi:hypothetical protein
MRLHKDKGVNPHLCICPRCGKENGEIILVGACDSVYKCSCGTTIYGGPEHPGCKEEATFVRKLEDSEQIPTNICKECIDKQNEADNEVKLGGVYWKCDICGSRGAIKHDSEMARFVREKAGVKTPNLVGIDFTKEQCPICRDKD